MKAHPNSGLPPAPEMTAEQKKRFREKLDELWPAGRGVSKLTAENAWKAARAHGLQDDEFKS